jgi:acyl-ACP thioesterase
MEELVAWPGQGRRYEHRTRVGLADAAPSGRARFDAIARWLQDAAWEDVTDAGLAETGAWVVRRTRVEVSRFPVFGERLTARTFCGGLGRMWAERRTSIVGEEGGAIETAGLWVYLDPATGRPRPIDDVQIAAWEPSSAGRRIKARLRHGEPPDGIAGRRPWAFAAADLDVAGHVNNAAYWRVLEELVPEPPARVAAEMEYRAPADAGPAEVIGDGGAWWIAGPAGIHASLRIEAGPG